MTLSGFAPSPFFALRTPALPFEVFESVFGGATAPAAIGDVARLEAALARDRVEQRNRLRDLVARPDVREALFVASPDLEGALTVWWREPESDRGQRVERALAKYVSRMAARATPFGLFAASAVGKLGAKTRLVLEGREACRRRSRLDMDFLCALTGALGADPAVRSVAKFRVNSSLHAVGDLLRYVETRLDGQERTFHLVAVENLPQLRRVLDGATGGATLDELAAQVADEEIDREEARSFVDELVEAQVLVAELPIRLTSEDALASLIDVLSGLPAASEVASRLRESAAELAAIDAAGLGAAPERYRIIAARLADLPVKPELARLFQVDLVQLAPRAELGERVLAEARRGLDLLRRMMPKRRALLAEFREAFAERYGEREVPLAEALDEESGVGFPAWVGEDPSGEPLLAGIRFPEAEPTTTRWGPHEEHLLKLLAGALAAGRDEIELGERDVEALASREPLPMPSSFTAAIRVAAPSEEALDRGDFRLLCEAASGPSGARYLGRFCHLDSELRRRVEEHLRVEEALEPDAVFAEIVHLPEGRNGNILARPAFREHEIPFLGDPGVDEEHQLPVTDLTVSVHRGEILLRSARLGRRVVPRLTAAHNYSVYGLGLYRFLCALQAQGSNGGVVWDWGALAAAPFLPRVRAGRIVLSTARWNLSREELEPLVQSDGAARFAAVAAWRARRRIPRRVYLAEDEAELLLDFDSVLSVDVFLHRAHGQEGVLLKEMFPPADELCAHGPEGRYVHEIHVSYVADSGPRKVRESADAATRPAAAALAAPRLAAAGSEVRRSFPPGSEWLSAKLYGGSRSLDRLLRGELGEAVQGLLAAGVADRWFFVRYCDPRPHLRLRLHGDPRQLLDEALPRLGVVLEAPPGQGVVWKVQLDTYEREIERYGGAEGIELAERIFHLDSDAVLALLRALEACDAGEEERWRLALVGADRLMGDLGLSPDEKLAAVEEVRRAYGREHREDAALKRSLAERLRQRDRELAELLRDGRSVSASLTSGLEILHGRSPRIRTIAERYPGLSGAAVPWTLRRPIVVSFVHMFLNRTLVAQHRRQELVLFDALLHTYRSLRARAEVSNAR